MEYDESGVVVLTTFIVLVIAGLMWKFSAALGVDFLAAVSIFLRVSALAISVAVACWVFGRLNISCIKYIGPIALALFWVCWWPALDFWATQSDVFRALGSTSSDFNSSNSIWWDAWYVKGGVFFALLGTGYSVRWLFRRR
ncbi:hypothetical protein FPJ27_15755 [Burkholderia sp. MS455]|uniref:hypothetical protein n=1 Tax=Burkholderia sp. MS455 TaxID=2811788 RepID=UPI00195D1AB2|nr:hypothetical protein [Burkholderia sp. MS455]QRR07706.1 hypothetical protein FPJ27_15755 [Burkholderia sp. MS455]